MRILFLLYNQQESLTESNNTPRISLSWVDALLNEVVKCDNLTVALAMPINNNSLQKGQKNNIYLYGLPNPEEKSIFKKAYKRLTRNTENTKIISYISQIVDDFEPDIIQIFGSENPFGLIVKKQNKPVIIHIQGYLNIWQRKWFTGITKWEQFRYTSLKNLILMQGAFHGYITFKKMAVREAVILKNCKYFMGRTNFDKRIVSLISPASTYFHCEEFIRHDFFEKHWSCLKHDEIVCVSILKGTSYKGLDLLIEALLILKRYSANSYKFNICGVSENDEIVKILKRKYRKEIGSIHIEFLGKLSADDIVGQLCNSNFYVHPSYIENSPNSVCEAMALGMPVISTNVGGVSSMINDEVDGILVQEGEPYSLAGAIVELTDNYEKAINLGVNARKRASKRHNSDDILKGLLKIYDTIIYEYGKENLS